MERDRMKITTRSAETVLVRLFREDPALADVEVKRAGLAEAFTELTNEKSKEAS
jgi:ABC-2 type transport system ATP-binding protein